MQKRLLALLAAAAVVAAALVAAAASGDDSGAAEKPEAAQKAAPAPDAPVVVVNGTTINRAEYDRALQAYLRNFQQQSGQMHAPDTEANQAMKRQVLDQVVARELLYQESKKFPVDDLEAQVADELEKIRGRFPDQKAFEQALASQDLTEEELRDLLARQVLVRHYVETQIQPNVEVTDDQVKKFFEENKERFGQPEQVKASHILIRVAPDATDEEREAAQKKAADLQKRAAAGEDFATLAKENSEDPGSAPNGGDLGYFPRDRMVPAFADAAFALEPGQVSDVVKTRFGYHVIKLTDKKPAKEATLDDVRDDITRYLQARALDEAVKAKVDELRKEATVEVVAKDL